MSRESENYTDRSSMNSTRSPQVRKEILREVLTRAESLTEDGVNDNTIQKLEEYMEETDTINYETTLEDKLNNPEEVLLDSKMMSISSHVLKSCSRSLTKNICSYSHTEFAEKIIDYFEQISDSEITNPDWTLLPMPKLTKFLPHYSTLLGALEPLEKKEIVRKKVERDAQAPIKKPENVVMTDKEEEGVEKTAQIMNTITRHFKTTQQPLDFFRLILHPTDFGKTIENILHVSFLARDGNVVISKDESGVLVVRRRSKEMSAQLKAGKGANIQNIVTINMSQWKSLVRMYEVKDPMI